MIPLKTQVPSAIQVSSGHALQPDAYLSDLIVPTISAPTEFFTINMLCTGNVVSNVSAGGTPGPLDLRGNGGSCEVSILVEESAPPGGFFYVPVIFDKGLYRLTFLTDTMQILAVSFGAGILWTLEQWGLTPHATGGFPYFTPLRTVTRASGTTHVNAPVDMQRVFNFQDPGVGLVIRSGLINVANDGFRMHMNLYAERLL